MFKIQSSNNVVGGYSVWVSDNNDRNHVRGMREEFRILCYEVPVLSMKQNNVLHYGSKHRLAVNVHCKH